MHTCASMQLKGLNDSEMKLTDMRYIKCIASSHLLWHSYFETGVSSLNPASHLHAAFASPR